MHLANSDFNLMASKLLMAKKEHLNQLFNSHTRDLNDILIEHQEVIACPICLRVFPRESIQLRLVNDGHVWPKDIRKKSSKAAQMQVLLCQECNSKASRADKQMQVFEKVEEGDKTGELYGTRLVEFLEEGRDKPAQARVNVQLGEDNSFSITGRMGKNTRFLDSSPDDQKRIEGMFNGQKKIKELTIHPPEDFIPGIVHGGWITSAYLMAFYALGYRYIMQSGMQTVRNFIIDSFNNKSKELPLPSFDNFKIENFVNKYFPHPLISLVFPLRDKAKVYLFVAFLDKAVTLPFRYNKNIPQWVFKQVYDKNPKRFDQLMENQSPLELRILCTKTAVHECIFDLLMGKPPTTGGQYNIVVELE